MRTVLWAALTLCAAGPASAAEVIVNSAPELSRAAREAKPGDRIMIAPGDYAGVVIEAHGEPDAPVLIAAQDPSAPPVFRDMIYAPNCAWTTFRDLSIRAAGGAPFNGLNADDGGDGSPAIGLRFERVHFAVGQGNALKLAGVDELVIDECVFEDWSQTGVALVGCHRGLIRNCRFTSSDPVFHGVQIKGGSSEIVVRGCTFEGPAARWINIGGGTDRDVFRPRDARFEAARITVEDNTIRGGDAAIAFDAAVDSIARRNRIDRPRRFVFRILNSTHSLPGFEGCRDGLIEGNRAIYRSDEIEGVFNLGYGADWRSFRLQGNHWYDELGARLPRWRGRLSWLLPSLWDLPAPETDGRYGSPPRESGR